MSDEIVAQAARRFIYARTALSQIHVEMDRATPTGQAELGRQAVAAGNLAIDAFLDMVLAIREEDITLDSAHPDHN
ncbi:MAG: hypothetical protein ABSH07_13070 [Candidatus Dormibacteria bacterium]